MKKIIAMIDGSQYTQSVCEHAAWIAQRSGAAVELLHVLGRRETSSAPVNLSGNITLGARSSLLEELSAFDEQRATITRKRGRAILDDAKGFLEAGGVSAETKLRFGDIVESAIEFESDDNLLVIGKRGEAADFAKLHLGSNMERIVRSCRGPIFVASRAFKPIERILIAYDGGTTCMKAADYIARSSLFAGLKCRLLSVGQDTKDRRTQLENAQAVLEAGGYEVDASVLPGQPETVISAAVESEGIDLLVMGAYGHSRIRSLIIGSTTSEMVRSCKIPIVLFR